MNREPLSPYVCMISGSLAFALMGSMAHALGHYCDWQLIAIARTGVCLVLVIGLALASGVRLVFLRPATLWWRSLAGSVSLVCAFYALPRLPVSDVLTLTHTFPVWVALLSWPMLGEVPSGGVWLAVVSGVLGVALIQQPHFAEGNFAAALALLSSLFTALAMLGLHRLQGVDPRAVVVHFSAVSLLFAVGALFVFDRRADLHLPQDSTPLLLLLGVGVTAAAGQLLLTRAFTAGAPAKVSVASLSQVVFAMGLELVLGGRLFTAWTLAGVGLVLGPTAWLLLRGRRDPAAAAEGE